MEMPIQTPLVEQLYLFVIAALLGGLMGLERQFSHAHDEADKGIIGVRTFIFITLTGAISAMISILYLEWFLALGFGVFSLLVIARYHEGVQCKKEDPGITTEMVQLIAFLIGALVYYGHIRVSIALAVIVTVVLSIKTEVSHWTQSMSFEDIRAILKFAVLTFIILPVLPQRAIDPWGYFNPYEVWIMVVLISGMGFVGYLLLKFVKLRGGIEWTGAIGGLLSSTATTLSFSRRSKESPTMVVHLTMGVLLACTIMFPRLLAIIWVVGPTLVRPLILPFSMMCSVGAATCIFWWFRYRSRGHDETKFEFSNPIEIGSAITFGAVFAFIKIISLIARQYLGDAGLYLTAAFGGIAELDAIALTVSRLVTAPAGQLIGVNVAVKSIVIAAVMNNLVKASSAAVFAHRSMKKPIIIGLGSMAAAGIIYLLLVG